MEILDSFNSDFIFSQGLTLPRKILNKTGFTLCCGFFRVDSNERTKRILKKAILMVFGLQDDQVVFNFLLLSQIERKHVFRQSIPFHDMEFRKSTVHLFKEPFALTCKRYNSTITVIPHHQISRHPEIIGEYVVHPCIAGTVEDRLQKLFNYM